ncbi:MAG: dihydroorotate dehydrogenase electron transfer subunit [Lachnospiraceae bacterium]|nr:dihydroorotate dehydrogenase electron transfer subunit [Lachnospiraceae bacterium]MBQ7507045.1 dihydroorotate dehydrogenase electron transfer subunit [Lachnospiraceae bacterium]
MSTPVEEVGVILSQKEIANGIFDLTVQAPEIAKRSLPGQFVSVFCRDLSRLLPRPISIADVGAEGTIRFLYRVAGAGTYEFSTLIRGDALRMTGPLGNGFPEISGNAVLFGGGIGIFPLLYLVKKRHNPKDIVFLGYRNKELFAMEEFARCAEVRVATEDGSFGVRGTVLDAAGDLKEDFSAVFSCGPLPMLKAVFAWAGERGVQAYLSLEERMACGVGACLGCAVSGKKKRLRVCKEGPVFSAGELPW